MLVDIVYCPGLSLLVRGAPAGATGIRTGLSFATGALGTVGVAGVDCVDGCCVFVSLMECTSPPWVGVEVFRSRNIPGRARSASDMRETRRRVAGRV